MPCVEDSEFLAQPVGVPDDLGGHLDVLDNVLDFFVGESSAGQPFKDIPGDAFLVRKHGAMLADCLNRVKLSVRRTGCVHAARAAPTSNDLDL